jgi:hypothetical protein
MEKLTRAQMRSIEWGGSQRPIETEPDERRHHRRVDPGNGAVEARPAGWRGWFSGNLAVAIIDISEGGAKLLLDRAVKEEDRLLLTIVIGPYREMFKLQAEVCRCAPSRTAGRFMAGVRFLDAPTALRVCIRSQAVDLSRHE